MRDSVFTITRSRTYVSVILYIGVIVCAAGLKQSRFAKHKNVTRRSPTQLICPKRSEKEKKHTKPSRMA